MDTRPDTFVTIDRFFHPTDAHIAAGKLDSEGIPVHLLGINHATANWMITGALGGIQLQVPLKYADRARQLLAESSPLETPEEENCPSCGGSDISLASTSWRLAFLTVHLFSLPLPWSKSIRRCKECKFEWSDEADEDL